MKGVQLMKKFFALVLTLTLLVGVLAISTTGVVAESTKSADNDLVVALQADATNLDPHVSGNGISNLITGMMYEPLLYFDENVKLQPKLAESWEMSDDGLSYTFHLRKGVKFTDGEDFNASAVTALYDRAMADDSLRLHARVAKWEKVDVVDDYTVTIVLKEPDNTFLNKLAQVVVVSPKAIKELGKEGLAKESAGTGPYILSERVDGGYTKMVRNENYWGEGPTVDTLTFTVVPEDGARIAMLKTGEADIIFPLPATHVEQLSDEEGIKVINIDGLTYRYVTMNEDYTLEDGRKPFADKRVRQAMNWAFDSEAYCKVVFNGYAKVPTSIFSKAIPFYSEQTPYTRDLEKARALMKEAGFEDGFPVEIWVDNTTVEMKGAEFLKQQLADINIDVKVSPMESTTIAEMAGEPRESTKIQMWYVNWSSGSYEADGSMRPILHSEQFPPEGYNTGFWSNEEFDKLLDQGLVEPDQEKVADLYAQAQALAWEECPWMFLGNDNQLFGMRDYVQNAKFTPGGDIQLDKVSLDH